ncbi:myeloid leukemia factor 1 [Caerostris darwini]|uniref:Myeloid leukemia factor 1 n=1 Tax=Caerostris darwini TaxID=1538125 RepID=A0AAV4SF38_9ARAC|nr:myeloid leukemia factor 1 [Caerostris darwini]
MFSLVSQDLNEDPFFSGPIESMRRMESMMVSPFGLFGNGLQRSVRPDNRPQNMMMPFGFGGSLFPNMDMFDLNPMNNCTAYSSTSMMTIGTDGSGRPQVYQESSTTRVAPGGVKETRHSVRDSSSGLQKMAIGHHLNERGHVIEKKKNRYTGEEEENEELINLEDDDAEQFNREWHHKARAFTQPRQMLKYDEEPRTDRQPEMLAITEGPSTSGNLTTNTVGEGKAEIPKRLKLSHDASGAAKKKSGKHKRKHGMLSNKSSSHSRASPYQ